MAISVAFSTGLSLNLVNAKEVWKVIFKFVFNVIFEKDDLSSGIQEVRKDPLDRWE